MALTFEEGGRERILQLARTLAEAEETPAGEILLEAVASAAAALCGREDIPRAMEGTLAILLARELRAGDGGAVASVKRGDTAITYTPAEPGVMTLLSPFARLRSPGSGRRP